MWVRQFDPGDDDVKRGFPSNPDLVLIFATTADLRNSAWTGRIRYEFPDTHVVGCSSGTMVAGDVIDDVDPVGVAIGFRDTRLKVVTQSIRPGGDDRDSGAMLGQSLSAPDLVAVFLLLDGLSGNASALVNGLRDTVGEGVAISGGLAGDGDRFRDTVVLVGGEALSDTVVAIGFYGSSLRLSHGSEGGWDTFGPTRTISRSSGTSLFEVDGAAALALYERYLGEEAANLPASGLLFPLEIWDADNPGTKLVRTLTGIDRETGAMIFAGDMPEGWQARLMHGSVEGLVSGANRAATKAVAHFGAVTGDVLCLMVSCVGRRLMMGQRAEDEVEEVFAQLPKGTVLSGFFSYGEIAPHKTTNQPCLHNQTMTLTLLGEAA
ncbi:FIST signal transduction protein [Croceicoccus hydrothermalis]|uniref:FIST signal transduction protein n=1 Tax=Croceicoccus hydrothermalis TaxID=2867964 RepID=UPI001EFAE16B|nr:FIST N-terminal domain-containing protein [Croceicoccus hydrothermalis]